MALFCGMLHKQFVVCWPVLHRQTQNWGSTFFFVDGNGLFCKKEGRHIYPTWFVL